MIQNKLVLYCARLEQAILWEACKRRRCATSNCLFKKIANHYGENLWSNNPLRISTITDATEYLDKLTQPIPLVRQPILGADVRKTPSKVLSTTEPSSETPPAGRKATTPPEPAARRYALPSDMLREEIIESTKRLM